MSTVDQVDALFGRGPFPHFQRSLGLFRPVAANVLRRAIATVLIGWVPLLVLVFAAEQPWSSALSFFTDPGTHARSLLAAPLLIICEVLCLKRLAAVAQHFVTSGLVHKNERPAFDALITSNRTFLNSTVAEIIGIVAAYAIAFALFRHLAGLGVRPWLTNEAATTLSPAGWWYAFVSMPLLLILFFGWLWRVALWGRFLIRIAAMKLRLIAAHPDKASGLKFLNSSIIAFTPLAFTFGVVAAGSAANRVLYMNLSIDAMQTTILGLVVVILILFVGPLAVFALKLHSQKVQGIFSYDALADRVGRQFEEKWLKDYEQFGSNALEAPDFSATTDLYQVVGNVHDMKVLPFELRAVLTLIVTTLLPFIPVVMITMPLRLIVRELAKLLV